MFGLSLFVEVPVLIHSFRFQNLNIALDVESGALHLLDDDAFTVVSAIEHGEDPYAAGVEKEAVDGIFEDIEELRAAQAFDTPVQEAPAIAGGSVIKSMCLHVAHDCNLRCKYCFASTGDFHGARMLMSVEIAKKSIDFLMEHSGQRKNLEVDLFGGEPLLNFDVCREIVSYGRECEKAYGKHINFTMTTNCVALNEERIAFLNREMHNVVISLDGRKEVHDALRPTVNGKGSYDIILDKAKRLVETRGDGEYYIRGTFTRNNLDFANDVKALCEEGFTQISVEPVILPADNPLSIRKEDLSRIQKEYDKLASDYIDARKSGRWYNFFHFMVDMEHGPCLRKRLSGCGTGTEYVAVTPEGDVYPCHQFVGLSEWKLGTVFGGELDADKQAQFANCNVATKEACRHCWAKYFCSGGCAANAYQMNGDIHKPHEISCALMRMRTECAIGIHIAEQK